MKKNDYKYDLGVIGCGRMSGAIILELRKYKIIISDIDKQAFLIFEDKKNITQTSNNQEVVANAKYILIAVKPQLVKEALAGLDFSGKILISIMAGVSISSLKDMAKGAKGIVRVMPNINAIIGKSTNAVCFDGLTKSEEKFVWKLVNSFGLSVEISEDKMDIFTGLAGSGPAFVFKFIRGMIMAGIECGLSEEVAAQFVAKTLVGSAENIDIDTEDEFDTPLKGIRFWIDAVCSPNGTTIEGVKYLDQMNFEDIVKEAVLRSKKRSEELSKK
ncbi:MAG: pyrroline-5-carboxylate reductase [Firmicutes bacterium]|nr:pyrroline-5-carboxylate reductase [Bacillota bacterium]